MCKSARSVLFRLFLWCALVVSVPAWANDHGGGGGGSDLVNMETITTNLAPEPGGNVRFIQLTSTGWDHHQQLREGITRQAGSIDKPIADLALKMLDVDPMGFDVMDRKLLEAVIHRFDGGPVGLDNIAASIGEERDTIEDVIEPYLIQQGFLQRTPRGRIATLAAYRHLGVAPPKAAGELFSE